MWSGNTVTNATDTAGSYGPTGELYKDKYSPILVDFRVQFNETGGFWTTSDYNNDSCYAFGVWQENGLVGNKRSFEDFVLCK